MSTANTRSPICRDTVTYLHAVTMTDAGVGIDAGPDAEMYRQIVPVRDDKPPYYEYSKYTVTYTCRDSD